jgi:hypothetical protein
MQNPNTGTVDLDESRDVMSLLIFLLILLRALVKDKSLRMVEIR